MLRRPRSTLFPYTTLFRSLDHAVDVSGRAVYEVELRAIVAVQTPRCSDPHAASAILVNAVGLLAVVTVSLGHARPAVAGIRSEEHTSDSSHITISYAVFCL